jgi:hypothetical protein
MESKLFGGFQKDPKNIIMNLAIGAFLFGLIGAISGYDYFNPPVQLFGFVPITIITGILGGLVLGLLLRDIKKIPFLVILGFIGSLFSVILGSIWFSYFSLPILIFVRYLGIPVFLILGLYFFKFNRILSATCFYLSFFVILDWFLIIIGIHARGSMTLVVFFFILIGLIIGALYGFSVEKTRTMAYFSMTGYSLGAVLIFIALQLTLSDYSISMTLINFLVGAITGIFLVAGLFYRPNLSN